MSRYMCSMSKAALFILMTMQSSAWYSPLAGEPGSIDSPEVFQEKYERQEIIAQINEQLDTLRQEYQDNGDPYIDQIIDEIDGLALKKEIKQALEMRLRGLDMNFTCNLNMLEFDELQDTLGSLKGIMSKKSIVAHDMNPWKLAALSGGALLFTGGVVYLLTRDSNNSRQQDQLNHYYAHQNTNFSAPRSLTATPFPGQWGLGTPQYGGQPAFRAQTPLDLEARLFQEEGNFSTDLDAVVESCELVVSSLKQMEQQFTQYVESVINQQLQGACSQVSVQQQHLQSMSSSDKEQVRNKLLRKAETRVLIQRDVQQMCELIAMDKNNGAQLFATIVTKQTNVYLNGLVRTQVQNGTYKSMADSLYEKFTSSFSELIRAATATNKDVSGALAAWNSISGELVAHASSHPTTNLYYVRKRLREVLTENVSRLKRECELT